MAYIKNKKDCCGCSACVSVCPVGCITMVSDSEGFAYASADDSACINCQRCTRLCDSLNDRTGESSVPKAYAAMSKDEDERLKSSSGGVFSLLARDVIRRGGAVFGAAFDKELCVRHICVEREEDICLLRGAKYAQSDIGDSYARVKAELSSGREVLFSGTPCQVAGLKGSLRKEYDKLTCIDFICHGVPSPLALEKYVEMREKKSGKRVTDIRFRDKREGWQDYYVSLSLDDRSEYASLYRDDEYMKAFLSNLTLRPSCYSCRFKSLSRAADITLADFWGIDRICGEMNDKKGTSLLLVHSRKGEVALSRIEECIKACTADPNEAVRYNGAAVRPAARPPERDRFMSLIQSKPFDEAYRKATPPLIVRKAKSFVKRVKRRLGITK